MSRMQNMNNKKVSSNQKVKQVHLQNIQKKLEHRLEVARMNGDEN